MGKDNFKLLLPPQRASLVTLLRINPRLILYHDQSPHLCSSSCQPARQTLYTFSHVAASSGHVAKDDCGSFVNTNSCSVVDKLPSQQVLLIVHQAKPSQTWIVALLKSNQVMNLLKHWCKIVTRQDFCFHTPFCSALTRLIKLDIKYFFPNPNTGATLSTRTNTKGLEISYSSRSKNPVSCFLLPKQFLGVSFAEKLLLALQGYFLRSW